MLIDRYNLFIFDWDGTLATSAPLVKIARLFKRRYSISHMVNRSATYKIDTVSEFVRQEDISRFYAFAYGVYSFFYKPKLKPGAMELLRELKKKGKKVAIFSDANRYRLLIEVKKLGVLDYADLMLSADSIKRYKPNPTGIKMILDNFRCSKSKCLYIGDMAADIFTARFAGVSSCVVGDGVDPHEVLRSVKPTYFSESIGALRSLK